MRPGQVLLLAGLLAGLPAATSAQPAPTSVDELRVESHPAAAPAEVEVRAWLDRTALWPGDRFHYTLEISCAPGVDVLVDDLAGDQLLLSGLELLSSEREREVDTDGVTRYRVRHLLTAYDVGTPLQIQEQTLRYYSRRGGQQALAAAPAGEVRVPALQPVLRSVLPDDLRLARLRDDAAPLPRPAFTRWARPLGLGLLLLCGLPVLLWAAPLLRRAWAVRAARRRAPATASLRGDLEQLQAVDAGSRPARRVGYERLDALLRNRLAELEGAVARALTAAELGERLSRRATPLPEALPEVLAECERARYAPDATLPSAERFSAGVALAGELLEVRRWS